MIPAVQVSQKVDRVFPVYFVVEAVVFFPAVDYAVSVEFLSRVVEFLCWTASGGEPPVGCVGFQAKGRFVPTKENVTLLHVVGHHPAGFFLNSRISFSEGFRALLGRGFCILNPSLCNTRVICSRV